MQMLLSSGDNRSSETAGLQLANWLDQQINSPPLLFIIVLVALFAVASAACLVKIKSRQPESDYEDTALTLNNGQTKLSPNHSISNHDQHSNDPPPPAHHGSANQYQVATLPLHSNSSHSHHHLVGHHRSRRHLSTNSHLQHMPAPDSPNQHQVSTLPLLHSSSSHHQSGQLPHTPCNLIGGSFSHWPRTPGSTMGCFMSGSGHAIHTHGAATVGGGGTPASTLDCVVSPPDLSSAGQLQQQNQPLDRWFDLGVSSQLVMANDLYGSYNWDYLANWTPDYQSLMPIVQSFRKQNPPWTTQWTQSQQQ